MKNTFSLHNVVSRWSNLLLPRRLSSSSLTVLMPILLSVAMLSQNEKAFADIGVPHESLISEFASFNTPGVVDGRVEAIAIDGDTVYVGGTFTQIHDPLDEDGIIDQPYLFAYSKSSGDIIREFDPQLSNSVLALETTGDASGGVFAGGLFGNLNGEFSRGRLAKIDINGDRVSGFGARPDAAVTSMVRLNDTLYIGGNFNSISSTPIEFLAAIDTTSGAVSPDLNLDFEGVLFTIPNTNTNPDARGIRESEAVRGVDDIDITSDGAVMVIVGNFTSINGISRPRLALLELDGQARVSTWNTDVFDFQCPAALFPVYIQGIDIAPDDSYLITGSNGFRRVGNPACDTVARYEIDDLTNTDVEPTWVNYTGGDSVFEVVATDHAVYAGGHFRWLNNDTSGNGRSAGPGSVERLGLAALDPLNGMTLLNWRSDRNPRGVGVFAMISEEEGLYLGDDTDFLNGTEHRKLKFLPTTTEVISRPDAPALPTTIVTPDGDDLAAVMFDGTNFGTPVEANNADWSNARGGAFIGGRLFHADSNSNMWMSVLNEDGTFLDRTLVDLFGLTDAQWDLDQIGGMFFDYEWSRIYYTMRNDSRLFWRAFTPAGPYFGNDEFVAENQGDVLWSDVRGMDVVDGFLYFSRTDNRLYRAQIDGVAVVPGTTVQISGPGIDQLTWDNDLFAFLSEGTIIDASARDAQIQFESSGSDSFRRFQEFEFPVAAGEEVVVRLQWDNPDADVALFVRDANDETVASDNSTAGSPKWVVAPAGAGGTYTAAVLIREGSTPFTLQVNPKEGPPPPPEPRADFEFTTSGSETEGRWQVFDFEVNAGELVQAEVIWDDPSADVNVFLRDESNSQVNRNTNGISSATVSAIAETSGTWSIGVRIVSGAVNYDVLVNTTTDFTPPEPGADFEFSSSGNPEEGRWQIFRFDVVAGESIDAQVSWDDTDAEVNVFLRDENNVQIDRDTDSSLPAILSAVAESSGRWSVAVRILSGDISYEILVNTTDP